MDGFSSSQESCSNILLTGKKQYSDNFDFCLTIVTTIVLL